MKKIDEKKVYGEKRKSWTPMRSGRKDLTSASRQCLP